MNNVENGNTVAVHYRGTLENGKEFDSSQGRDPLSFEVGSGSVIQGFNDAVLGMTEGESKTFTLSAANAYGERNEDAVQLVEKTRFPEGFNSEIGQQVTGHNEVGQQFQATVTEVQDETVTLDFNHPLAGEELTFEVEVVNIG